MTIHGGSESGSKYLRGTGGRASAAPKVFLLYMLTTKHTASTANLGCVNWMTFKRYATCATPNSDRTREVVFGGHTTKTNQSESFM
jgi:hypothetical protein